MYEIHVFELRFEYMNLVYFFSDDISVCKT